MQSYYHSYNNVNDQPEDDSKPQDYSSDWWRTLSSKMKSTIASTTAGTAFGSTPRTFGSSCASSSDEAMSTPSSSTPSSPSLPSLEQNSVLNDSFYGDDDGYSNTNVTAAYATTSHSKSVVQWKRRAVTAVASPFTGKTKTD